LQAPVSPPAEQRFRHLHSTGSDRVIPPDRWPRSRCGPRHLRRG